MHINDETIWRAYLQGTHVPKSAQYKEIIPQFKKMQASDIDVVQDFESGNNIGSTVNKVKLLSETGTNLNSKMSEGSLFSLNSQSPHDTKGVLVEWSAKNVMQIKLATFTKDVLNFNYISLRVGQAIKYTAPTPGANQVETTPTTSAMYDSLTFEYEKDSTVNAELKRISGALPYRFGAVSEIKDMEVSIEDNSGNTFSIPFPEKIYKPTLRENRLATYYPNSVGINRNGTPLDASDDSINYAFRNPSKSAMQTITIPLSEFASNGVDLSEVKWLRIKFPLVGSGEMIFDSIEFIS